MCKGWRRQAADPGLAGEKSQTRKPLISRSRSSSAALEVAAGKFMLLEKLETMICNLCLLNPSLFDLQPHEEAANPVTSVTVG